MSTDQPRPRPPPQKVTKCKAESTSDAHHDEHSRVDEVKNNSAQRTLRHAFKGNGFVQCEWNRPPLPFARSPTAKSEVFCRVCSSCSCLFPFLVSWLAPWSLPLRFRVVGVLPLRFRLFCRGRLSFGVASRRRLCVGLRRSWSSFCFSPLLAPARFLVGLRVGLALVGWFLRSALSPSGGSCRAAGGSSVAPSWFCFYLSRAPQRGRLRKTPRAGVYHYSARARGMPSLKAGGR